MEGIPQATLNRRAFCQLLGVSAGLLVFSSCGGSSADGSVTLNFWTPGGSKTFCDAQNNIAQNFAKTQKNVRMATVKCGTGQQDFNEVLLARIAAGNPPDATILWNTPVALGVRGALQPIDDLMEQSQHAQKKKWPGGVLSSTQFGGKTYGLPVTAGTYALWFNQEWFEKKGIPAKRENAPKTWQEMRQLSKEFTVWQGKKLISAGFLPTNIEAETLPIWSALNGGQLFDAENQKYTINSENNVTMMEFMLDWLNQEYKGDMNAISNSASWGVYPGSQGQQPAFQQGKLAMMLQGSWVLGDFYASIKPTFEKWEVASLPIGPNGNKVVSGAWPNWLVIPKGAKHTTETFQFLDYMSSEGVKTWFASVPDLPTNTDAPSDLLSGLLVEKRGETYARDALTFFRKQLDIVTPMWNSPIQDFANDTIKSMLEQIWKKAAKPAEAMMAAQKACQDKLESFLRDQK